MYPEICVQSAFDIGSLANDNILWVKLRVKVYFILFSDQSMLIILGPREYCCRFDLILNIYHLFVYCLLKLIIILYNHKSSGSNNLEGIFRMDVFLERCRCFYRPCCGEYRWTSMCLNVLGFTLIKNTAYSSVKKNTAYSDWNWESLLTVQDKRLRLPN